MWGLAILIALWVLVGPIFALVSASNANRRVRELDDQLRRFRLHFDETVGGLLAKGTAAPAPPTAVQPARVTPQPEAPGTPAAAPQPAAPLTTPPTVAPPPVPRPAAPVSPPLAKTPVAVPPLPDSPPPPARIPPAAIPPTRGESLESKIGARWSVIVGGLALGIGAIFLVKYSIEQGLLGPAPRIALGFLLSLVLFGLGEWMRRRDRALNLPVFAQADVPAILTGAGGVALFATIYAAYALYGFIGPAAAFVLLTVAGLITLLLSVIHGPALAALGALGSYVAPLLVSSAEPAPFPLVFHTIAVTAAVLGMARIRGWQWLTAAGIVASLLWGFALTGISADGITLAEVVFLAALTALFVGALLAGVAKTGLRDRAPEPYALLALAGVALLSLVYGRQDDAYPLLASTIVLTGVLGAVANRWTAAAGAVAMAAALSVLTVMILPPTIAPEFASMRISDVEWTVLGDAGIGVFAMKAFALALVVGLGSFLSADRAAATARLTAGAFAAAGAGAPLLFLIVVYLRHVPFETRPAVGLVALILAAIYAAMTERLIASRPADDTAPAPALYAAGAVLALSFAMAVGLSPRVIPISLSLGAAGVVWVGLYRPVKILAWLAVALAALACVAVFAGPAFTPEEIGTTPILNGLILRLGLPAAAILFAGETLRRRRNGIEAAILQTLGLVIGAFFVALEIRHAAGGGDITYANYGLGEQSAYTLAALAFALGLQFVSRQTRSPVYRGASLAAGFLGAAAIAIAHLITANPLITGGSVGTGIFLNLLLPGYLLPAIAAAVVALAAREVRPRPYVLLMAALALALSFAYVSLMVRHAFHGEYLDGWEMRDAENWTYSAVWLAFGILLLAAGILLRSTMVRAASALVIAVVVFKVFLFDMAALTGVLRAVSFLGLGATLIVIGRLYQRLLLSGRAEEQQPTPT